MASAEGVCELCLLLAILFLLTVRMRCFFGGSFLLFVFVFAILWCLFLKALRTPGGRGLTSLLFCMWCFLVFFVTFPYAVLGQVWYLVVLIPDICLILYFYQEHFFKIIWFWTSGLRWDINLRYFSSTALLVEQFWQGARCGTLLWNYFDLDLWSRRFLIYCSSSHLVR